MPTARSCLSAMARRWPGPDWLPQTMAVLAVAVTAAARGPVEALLPVLGCGVPAVAGARLLQALYLCWRREGAGYACRRGVSSLHHSRHLRLLAGCVLTAALLIAVKAEKPAAGEFGAQERLGRLLLLLRDAAFTAALLAAVFELAGTPRAELARALSTSRTGYSEGAAWLFFLGYLEMSFGDGGTHFAVRMEDYLTSQGIGIEDRGDTCKAKMFILLPMTPAAANLSDENLNYNDSMVQREMPLGAARNENERRYGEMHVYNVSLRDGSQRHFRLAMEEATPLRTAHRAFNDHDTGLNVDDYEAFASGFYETLKAILREKSLIACQLELVPIYQADRLGWTVAQRFLELQGRGDELGGAASRQPEESSELGADWVANM